MLRTGLVALAIAVIAPAGQAFSQTIFAYPNQGQSQEQQDMDRYQCHTWAVQQSGFDPMQTPTASSPPPQQESTGPGVVGGAAGGAAIGAIGGAIAGDAGKGAAIGAVSGGLLGGVRSQRQNRQNQQARQNWEQQQAAQYQNARNGYNRAFAACMEARGYTVS